MSAAAEQQIVTLGSKIVTWQVVVWGTMSASPGAEKTLSDPQLADAAARSGAFDFLERPDEDVYSLDDGDPV